MDMNGAFDMGYWLNDLNGGFVCFGRWWDMDMGES